LNQEKSTIDLKNIQLKDIIDMDFLQSFQDDFATGVGIASVTVDANGTPITKPSQYTRFCMDYVHSTEIGDNRCAKCHHQGGLDATNAGKPVIYECHAGLIDFAAPIILEGYHIGTILGGQVLTHAADETICRKTAQEIGVDEDGIIAAAKEVHILERERIESAANLLFKVANSMSKDAYQKMKLQNASETLNDGISQISATMEELAASASTVADTQTNLNKEIKNVNAVTGKINEVMDFIKDIADETRLLGLNAAIEAARAGEAGLGFGVVAQEIRKLSADSKKTVGEIKELTTLIRDSVDKTVSMGNDTTETIEQQAAAIEEVTASVEEIHSLTDQLNMLALEK
jgi:ligand-binding sensor protein